MFDIGATELLLVAIIGLIVVGPERLPRLARSIGLWVNRARRQMTSIQREINRELEMEDLKKQLQAKGGGLTLEDLTGDVGSKAPVKEPVSRTQIADAQPAPKRDVDTPS
ncbi:MAG: twin-arginine translocase subunit TatB [Gammaproteobacteria bacterium]|nr:twin-arginine translocase subunit TatB [Gammaproteobacteria bacterium]